MQLTVNSLPDFQSETYKDAYSRINAIVIEGEQEAYDNYIQLSAMLPQQEDELIKLSKMENRHMKGFQACAKNLAVTPDMGFAKEFFSRLHSNFQTAAAVDSSAAVTINADFTDTDFMATPTTADERRRSDCWRASRRPRRGRRGTRLRSA